MPSVSKSQQRLFCMALAVRKGDLARSKVNKSVLDIVDGDMTNKQIEDFTVRESGMMSLRDYVSESILSSTDSGKVLIDKILYPIEIAKSFFDKMEYKEKWHKVEDKESVALFNYPKITSGIEKIWDKIYWENKQNIRKYALTVSTKADNSSGILTGAGGKEAFQLSFGTQLGEYYGMYFVKVKFTEAYYSAFQKDIDGYFGPYK